MLRCKPANQLSAKLKLFFSSDVDTPLSPSNLSTHYYVVDKRGFERSSAAPASQSSQFLCHSWQCWHASSHLQTVLASCFCSAGQLLFKHLTCLCSNILVLAILMSLLACLLPPHPLPPSDKLYQPPSFVRLDILLFNCIARPPFSKRSSLMCLLFGLAFSTISPVC